jgi:DNA invertase Pin-like site-specific DNA recombinase
VNVLHTITTEKKAHFKAVDNQAMDTTGQYGKIPVYQLAMFAEQERDLMLRRTSEANYIVKIRYLPPSV